MVNGVRLETIQFEETTFDRHVADKVECVQFAHGREHVFLLALTPRFWSERLKKKRKFKSLDLTSLNWCTLHKDKAKGLKFPTHIFMPAFLVGDKREKKKLPFSACFLATFTQSWHLSLQEKHKSGERLEPNSPGVAVMRAS